MLVRVRVPQYYIIIKVIILYSLLVRLLRLARLLRQIYHFLSDEWCIMVMLSYEARYRLSHTQSQLIKVLINLGELFVYAIAGLDAGYPVRFQWQLET